MYPHRTLLALPNVRVWVQTPHPQHYDGVCRLIGDGPPPGLAAAIGAEIDPPAIRQLGWVYAGQVNNSRREEATAALNARRQSHGDGLMKVTRQFGNTDPRRGGQPYQQYVHDLLDAKVAPAPSGTFSPDTFRLFEALEAGCVPIVDRAASSTPGETGYWPALFGGDPPFPILDRWEDFSSAADRVIADVPRQANICGAWWLLQKRRLAHLLVDDLRDIGAIGT